MPIAFILALITATLNGVTAIANFAISRAPGWRSARAFGVIAVTATCYSLGNVVFCTGTYPDWVYLAATRWNYVWGNLHILAWFPIAFGGRELELRLVPRPLQALMTFLLAVTAVLAVTGWHLEPGIVLIPVDWAGVVYRYGITTPLGDWYGIFSVLVLSVPLTQCVLRLRRGEPGMRLVVAGFVVFYGTAIAEVMVANGDLVWISPADIGFLAVVAPTSVRMLRRFIEDAKRLHEATGMLEEVLQERTAQRDRAETALVESERLAALGRLAAGVGHEINNPLTYLQLSLAELDTHLRRTGPPSQVSEAMASAMDGAMRIEKVVGGLRTYSRGTDERRVLEPADAVRAALKVAGAPLRQVARVDFDKRAAACVLADEPRLVQALVNLLVNAAQAVAGRADGRILVRTSSLDRSWLAIDVEDNGPGVPESARTQIMEPYFTTRAGEGGLGLGLFVTRGIIDAHGGRLECLSGSLGGACLRIVLPAHSSPPLTAASASAPAADPGSPSVAPSRERPRLLLIDDEPLVVQLLAHALAARWQVTSCSDGEQAWARLERDSFDVVLCDLMMPGLSGMQLAERLATHEPRLRERMVFLTGGAVTAEAQEFLERPDVVHLMKPLEVPELEAGLRAVIEQSEA